MRRLTVGVSVYRDTIEAIAMRGRETVWHHVVSADARLGPDDPLLELFQKVQQRVGIVPVVVAVGPHAAQLRMLEGLPSGADKPALDAAIRLSRTRFLIAGSTGQELSPVVSMADKSWIAAVDTALVERLISAAARAQVPLDAIVPAAGLPGSIAADGPFSCTDGELAWIGIAEGGQLRSLRRVPSSHPDCLERAEGDLLLSPTQAARAASEAPTATRFNCIDRRRHPRRDPWRLPLLAAVTGLAVAAIAPAMLARHAETEASSRLTALAPQLELADRQQRSAQRQAIEQEIAATFTAGVPPMTETLRSLTQQLSDASWVSSVRIDSLGGTLAVRSLDIAAALDEVQRMPRVDSAWIAGAITSEIGDDSRHEQGTLRFAWRRLAAGERGGGGR